MSVAQTLYEGVDLPQLGAVGLITYMRTDSLRISDEAAAAAASYVEETYGRDYLPRLPPGLQDPRRCPGRPRGDPPDHVKPPARRRQGEPHLRPV